MKKSLILICAIFLLQGCITATSFVKTIDRNPGLSIQEAKDKLGSPVRTSKVKDDIICQVYKVNSIPYGRQFAVYFKEGKLYAYGDDSQYFHLDTQYKLGLIPQEEYRWRCQQLQQQALIQAQTDAQRTAMAMQMFSNMQQTQYQQQQLNLQKQQLQLQQRQNLNNQLNNQRPIVIQQQQPAVTFPNMPKTYDVYDTQTGETSTYQVKER